MRHAFIPRRLLSVALLAFLGLFSSVHGAEVDTGDPELDAAFDQILSRDFGVKEQGIEALSRSRHPKAGELLRGILDGTLRFHKKTKRLVWATEQGGDFLITDALSGEHLGTEKKRKVKKIPINRPCSPR
jgi:urea transport system permease protein